MAEPSPRRTSLTPGRAAWLGGLGLAGASLLITCVVVFSGLNTGRGAFDQNQFHLRAIARFADTWPNLDFRDYESATTPGYHVVMGLVRRWLTMDLAWMQVIAWGFTGGLLGLLGATCAGRVGVPRALALGLPVLASLYVLSSGVWLLPDNAAWLGVLAILLLSLRPRVDAWTLLLGGAVLAALVCVRQAHVWSAGLLWIAGWLGPGRSGPVVAGSGAPVLDGRWAHEWSSLRTSVWPMDLRRRVPRALAALLVTLPAIGLVLYFIDLWDGLTPPMFQTGSAQAGERLAGASTVTGGNPATPALTLALVGIMGPCYLGYMHAGVRGLVNLWPVTLVACAAGLLGGALLALAPETSYSFGEGRWSGLWNVVRQTPVVLERSPIMVLLSAAGGGLLGLLWSSLPPRDRWVMFGGLAGFVLAQSANALSWQRYLEPFLLLWLAVGAARASWWGRRRAEDGRARGHAPVGAPAWSRVWSFLGPAVLAVLLGAVTLSKLLER